MLPKNVASSSSPLLSENFTLRFMAYTWRDSAGKPTHRGLSISLHISHSYFLPLQTASSYSHPPKPNNLIKKSVIYTIRQTPHESPTPTRPPCLPPPPAAAQPGQNGFADASGNGSGTTADTQFANTVYEASSVYQLFWYVTFHPLPSFRYPSTV